MKLTFYLPQYQIHRLYQLESLSDLSSITSLKHYRKRACQHATLLDSIKDTNVIIESMIANNDCISTMPLSNTPTPCVSCRLQHRQVTRKKGGDRHIPLVCTHHRVNSTMNNAQVLHQVIQLLILHCHRC